MNYYDCGWVSFYDEGLSDHEETYRSINELEKIRLWPKFIDILK